MEAKGRKYEKKDKEFWSKTGQRNVKTIHKTSGRFPRKKEASRDTTGEKKAETKSSWAKGTEAGVAQKKKPERRMYLPWES